MNFFYSFSLTWIYRDRETDLDEVLQTPHIYTNVSQGEIANERLLEKGIIHSLEIYDLTKNKGFQTTNKHEICLKILEKGEIQLSSEERKKTIEQMFKDIAQIIVEKCINAETQEVFHGTPTSKIDRYIAYRHKHIDTPTYNS